MPAEQFDALTRAVAQGVSRRRVLKMLAGTLATGIVGLLDGRSGRDAAALTESVQTEDALIYLPLVEKPCTFGSGELTFEAAAPAEVEAILEEAEDNEDFQALHLILEAATLQNTLQEGAFILEDGVRSGRLLVLHYEPSDAADQTYLVYSASRCDDHIVYAFNIEIDNQIGLGFYRNADGVIKTEVVSFGAAEARPAAPAGQAREQERPAADDGGCQLCIDNCLKTRDLRQRTCALRVVANYVASHYGAWSQFYRALRQLPLPVGDIIDQYTNIQSARGSVSAVAECLMEGQLDCTADSAMCRSMCAGCDGEDGVTCRGNKLCIDGDCRQPCGGQLCQLCEMCAPQGECIPFEDTCGDYTYMGCYRFGDAYGPACCAILGGIDCGAMLPSGIWGGCCPPTTLCKPIDVGYGCCTPGLNC